MTLRKRVLDRLPNAFSTMATDTGWTMLFEVLNLMSVTITFSVLGSRLGPAGYGEYIGMFAIASPLGAVGYASYLAVLQRTVREGDDVGTTLGRFLALTAGIGVLVSAITVGIGLIVLETIGFVELAAVAIGDLILIASIRVMSSAVRAVHGVAPSVRVELAPLVARLAVVVALWATDTVTIRNLVIGWMFANLAILFYMVAVHMPRLGLPTSLRTPVAKNLSTVLAFGTPIFVNDFQGSGDKVVMNAVDQQEEAGLYGVAYRVVTLAITPLRAMDSALFHRFLPSDDDAVGQHLARAKKFTWASLAVVMPIALAVLLLAPQLQLIVGGKFDDSVGMTRWLVLWIPLRAAGGAPLNGLLGLNRLGLRLSVLLVSAAVSIIMYIALIPAFGWEGALIGTLVSETFETVGAWLVLIKAQRDHDAAAAEARAGDMPDRWLPKRH